MEEQQNKPAQNKWDLITGIGLILFGSYKLYNHYVNLTEMSTIRLALTFGFVGFGFYNLYKYVKAGQA